MEKTQHQDMEFLGVRDEFEATGRHLDSFISRIWRWAIIHLTRTRGWNGIPTPYI